MEPWRDALLALLKPGGRAWWLEDPLQNLYDRPPVALPGWVGLTADTNYRTPADVLALLNARLPLPAPVARRQPGDRQRAGDASPGATSAGLTGRHQARDHARARPGLPPRRHRAAHLPRPRALALHPARAPRPPPPARLHRPLRPARRAGALPGRAADRLGVSLQGPVRALHHLHRDRLRGDGGRWTSSPCASSSSAPRGRR